MGHCREHCEERGISVQQPDRTPRILIEGLTADEMLALPDEHVAALVAVGPVVFRAGLAEMLGQIRLHARSLMIELAQIDGGGEGVLPVLWRLAERYARQTRIGCSRVGRSCYQLRTPKP